MKYEEQSWNMWHVITVLAACAQLAPERARPQFRRELVRHIPTTKKTFLSHLGKEGRNKEIVWHTISTMDYSKALSKETEEL